MLSKIFPKPRERKLVNVMFLKKIRILAYFLSLNFMQFKIRRQKALKIKLYRQSGMVLSPKINMHIEIRICFILSFKNSKLSLEIFTPVSTSKENL